jgi:hypothetical protein
MSMVVVAKGHAARQEKIMSKVVTIAAVVGCALALTACGDDEDGGESGPCDVPSSRDALDAFLADGTYTAWNAESGIHESTGPHFGGVLTYVDDTLFASLEAGGTSHPQCSASIKELFGDGDTVLGHAVMVKTGTGDTGDDWYWYEVYNGSAFADGAGAVACTGCHEGGTNYVLSPFPLQ